MIEKKYKEAFVEVLCILNNTEKEAIDKIPKKLLEFFKDNASQTYTIHLDFNQDIYNMNLKRETLALLAMIYRNYWCTPEERKEYDKLLDENEKKYQEELREKYNPDNLFKNTESKYKPEIQIETREVTENFPIQIQEVSFYQKIINFIKNLFTRKNK